MTRKPDPFTEAASEEAHSTITLAYAELTRYIQACDIADLVVTDEIEAARKLADSYQDQTAVVRSLKAELEKASDARRQTAADIADSAEDGADLVEFR